MAGRSTGSLDIIMATRRGKVVLANKLATFVQQYQRKSQRGVEPNDRRYSAEVEQKLKQLQPEQIAELLAADEGEVPTPRTKRKQPDPRFISAKKRRVR
jgi:hypothetical protein